MRQISTACRPRSDRRTGHSISVVLGDRQSLESDVDGFTYGDLGGEEIELPPELAIRQIPKLCE
jgi:hypothetical protein